jgi:anti-anti-sigma factor
MKVNESQQGDILVLAIAGRIIDPKKINLFHDLVRGHIEKGQKYFIIDLKKVEITNSLGLGMLVGTYASVKRAEGRLVLANVDSIKDLIIMMRLTVLFDIYDSLEEAVQSFKVPVG